MRIWLMLTICGVLGACAGRIEIVDLYQNPDYAGKFYSRVLVADISGSTNERADFEKNLAAAIREAGVEATPSYQVAGIGNQLDAESILAAVDESGADAVLVTHMVSVAATAPANTERVDIQKKCRQGSVINAFLYDYPEVEIPDDAKSTTTTKVVANLYDAADSERIWAVQSTCFNRERWEEMIVDQSDAIAQRLQRLWGENSN